MNYATPHTDQFPAAILLAKLLDPPGPRPSNLSFIKLIPPVKDPYSLVRCACDMMAEGRLSIHRRVRLFFERAFGDDSAADPSQLRRSEMLVEPEPNYAPELRRSGTGRNGAAAPTELRHKIGSGFYKHFVPTGLMTAGRWINGPPSF